MFRLDGKTIAVIGAGSGIGQAVALGVAQQGGHTICLDINAANAAATAEMIAKAGGSADAGAVDIADETSVRDALANALHQRPGLDGLVCTPAINVRKPILKYTGEEFDRVVRVNLRGNFNVLQAAGQLMVLQKSGSIVLFSSIRSLVTEPGQSVYSMTKAGIVQLVRTAATEWGEQGVRVNAVGPGVIETPLTAPIKAQADVVPGLRRQDADEALGEGRGNGGADRVPAVGRRQLRDRHHPVRRRRLARQRRPLHAAGDVATPSPAEVTRSG